MEDIDGDGFSTLEVSFICCYLNICLSVCYYCTVIMIVLKPAQRQHMFWPKTLLL